jgi:hypothetical protein
MAIRKTAQAAGKGQGTAKTGKGGKKAKPPKVEATILDDDPEPEEEEPTEAAGPSEEDEDDDPELAAPLPPAGKLPSKSAARAPSRSGKYVALVTIRNGEDVHRAGSTFALSPEVAAEYLKLSPPAIRAA